MAWNPSSKVAAARDIGKRFGKDQVIVLMIDSKLGTLEYASYGKTKELCADAKALADIAFDSLIFEVAAGAGG